MKIQRKGRVSLFVLLAMCAAVSDAFGQVPTGTILGTVKDTQGLSIVGAQVTLTNQGTTSTQTDTTSSRGGFQFTHLNAGFYQVEISKPGFKNSVVLSIKLDASTEYTVPPIALGLGAVTGDGYRRGRRQPGADCRSGDHGYSGEPASRTNAPPGPRSDTTAEVTARRYPE